MPVEVYFPYPQMYHYMVSLHKTHRNLTQPSCSFTGQHYQDHKPCSHQQLSQKPMTALPSKCRVGSLDYIFLTVSHAICNRINKCPQGGFYLLLFIKYIKDTWDTLSTHGVSQIPLISQDSILGIQGTRV